MEKTGKEPDGYQIVWRDKSGKVVDTTDLTKEQYENLKAAQDEGGNDKKSGA